MESFSKADLKKVGAARYANDHSTEILCCAFALGDEDPYVWKQGEPLPNKYREALLNPTIFVWAHNAQFELFMMLALAMKTWSVPCPGFSRFKCTMSLARRAALPAKLEKLAEVLELKAQKDARGKTLIRKFSVMQKPKAPNKRHPDGLPARRILPSDEPEAFEEFCEYCVGDVKAEREAAHRLAYFNCEPNNSNYTLDAIINARGVPVNLPALHHAQRLIDEETEIVSEKFRQVTGFEVTQNAKLLEWCREKGEKFENLQAETIDSFLEEQAAPQQLPQIVPSAGTVGYAMVKLPAEKKIANPEVIKALRLKQSIAYASIKKIPAMIACAGPRDNRLRGMMAYHIATTGRWGGQLVQLQNVRRSTMKDSEQAYADICAGMSREMLEITYGPVLETIANCIRHFVEDKQ